jgi:thiol-disulfide isomerase/thioredoxin
MRYCRFALAVAALATALGVSTSAPDAPAKTCRVTGTITISEYAKAGGSLDRGIVYVYTDPGRKQVAYHNEKSGKFAIDLAPGNYILQCTGVGSRGAIFVPTDKKITVKDGEAKLDVGEIDMPSGKVTKLFGKAAPELDGAIAWKNTDALTMKGLKGKVVVLDFWSFSCSICLHHKPDLAKLQEKYKGKPLAVLTVHDGSAETMEDVDAKVPDPIKKKAGHLAVALDRKGAKGIFASYGATAVPMVIVIDQEGTVVRRFHHAGDPELEKEVERLLAKKK